MIPAQIAKVQTLVDGGIRVTLDYPETAIDIAAQLMELKRMGGLVEIIPVKQSENRNEIPTRSEWKS